MPVDETERPATVRVPGEIGHRLFAVLYRLARRRLTAAPIRRVVGPVPIEHRQAFDRLLTASLRPERGGRIDEPLPHLKAAFLNYLCDWRGYVAHGSPLAHLTRLEPLRLGADTTAFGNRRQVFGSPDALWAMWFAIVDKTRVSRTDNGCVRVDRGPGRVKYYHFELPREARATPPFVTGRVYLARPEDYPERRDQGLLDWLDAEIEEWGSAGPVTPLLSVAVAPDDFPYLDRVQYRL